MSNLAEPASEGLVFAVLMAMSLFAVAGIVLCRIVWVIEQALQSLENRVDELERKEEDTCG